MPDKRLNALRRLGVIQELADVFGNGIEAQALLESIEFPRGRLPVGVETANDFWDIACRVVANGLVPGGLPALVAAALDQFRYNEVFARGAAALTQAAAAAAAAAAEPMEAPAAAPAGAEPMGAAPVAGSRDAPLDGEERPAATEMRLSLIVTGYGDDLYATVDLVRELARGLGISVTIGIGWASPDSIQFRLDGATDEQILGLGREIEARTAGRAAFSRVSSEEDYLLHRLLVEGPDQAHFELSNIPASTKIKDISRAVLSEYRDSNWPRDPSGEARPAVMDHVPHEGKARRLEPHQSLQESGVRDGDLLQMAPEATAGSVNPQFREEHLARARAQVLTYAGAHPGFEVLANATVAPTEYLFRFREAGWAPPLEPGDAPAPIDKQEVLLILPPDFPVVAPKAYWQTPIFHPNVEPKSGKVCLGVLEDRYRPGLDFGQICQVLRDMAGYRNYETREGYNLEAQRWALSPEGQAAIESRGGRSVTRKFLAMFEEALLAPLPIRIRRRDQ